MELRIKDPYFPGSVIRREDRYGRDGKDFLDRVFFLSDGIMLQQIKEISGVDGTTLQNWVKRGWIGNTVHKRYSENQLARILLINMLRSSMRLDRIDFLLRYINGTINDESDDIIPETELYGLICRIADEASESGSLSLDELSALVRLRISDFPEKMPGAREKLEQALVILLCAYSASLMIRTSSDLFERIAPDTEA